MAASRARISFATGFRGCRPRRPSSCWRIASCGQWPPMAAVISRSRASRSRRRTSARAASTARRRNSCSSPAPAAAEQVAAAVLQAADAFVVPRPACGGAAAIWRRSASRRASCGLLPRQAPRQAAAVAPPDRARHAPTPRLGRPSCAIAAGEHVELAAALGRVPRGAAPAGAATAPIWSQRRASCRTCLGVRLPGRPAAAKRLAPAAPGRRAVSARPASARCWPRLGLLPGRRAPGVQRHQFLQGGQLLLGRRQPAGDRPAAARKLPVERVALLLGLLDLQLEHAELLLAGVELPGVGPLEHHLAQRRGPRCRPARARPAASRASR